MNKLLAAGFSALVAFQPIFAEEKPWENPRKWLQENGSGHDFSKLEDEEIRKRLALIVADDKKLQYEMRDEFEALLNEISGRPLQNWEDDLKKLLEKVREKKAHPDTTDHFWDIKDLEVLTALRRLQGKADPLRIGKKKLEQEVWSFPQLPIISISASRTPGEKDDFYFTFGGNYRTGRLARWTVLAWDEHGKQVSRELSSPSMMGGGMFSRKLMGGETWESGLSLAPFLQSPLAPGRYHACLAYHNEETVAGSADLKNHLLSFSGAFSFVVKPLEIAPLDVELGEIKKLVKALPAEGRIKILSGTYNENHHDFIDPKSAAGRILTKGWMVLPALVELAGDAELTTIQRGWLLGIMHSISTKVNPTDYRNVVTNYDTRSGGYWIESKVNGKFQSAGGGMGGHGSSNGGEIDEKAQLELVNYWKKILPNLVTIERKN